MPISAAFYAGCLQLFDFSACACRAGAAIPPAAYFLQPSAFFSQIVSSSIIVCQGNIGAKCCDADFCRRAQVAFITDRSHVLPLNKAGLAVRKTGTCGNLLTVRPAASGTKPFFLKPQKKHHISGC